MHPAEPSTGSACPRRCRYGPQPGGLVAVVVWFGAVAAVFAGCGGGLRRTAPPVFPGAWVCYGAAWVCWAAAAGCTLLAVAGLIGLVRCWVRPQFLELSEEEVRLPLGVWRTGADHIRFEEIRRVRQFGTGVRPTLFMATGRGVFHISGRQFAEAAAASSVVAFVRSHITPAAPGRAAPDPLSAGAAEAFQARKRVLDRHLTHLGPFPWGIIFTLILVLPLVAVAMVSLLGLLAGTGLAAEDVAGLRGRAAGILGSCIVVLIWIHLAQRSWRVRVRAMDFPCPSCGHLLAGGLPRRDPTAERCPTCGRAILDP